MNMYLQLSAVISGEAEQVET